ncbi:P-loop containing nucleoside triphosphate hydrolase protein [Flammula alnicola]|nr:P-loop containing nucleoside triphosphate hydrolase protein [Flammula alnicola]
MFLARNISSAAATARIPPDVLDVFAAPSKDPSSTIESISEAEEDAERSSTPAAKDPATHFHTLREKLHNNTLKAITEHPFQHTHMSAVQARIFPLLPHLAEPHDAPSSTSDRPRDLLVKAKTGTGKTMAFLVPAIEARLKTIDAHVAQAQVDSGIPAERWSAADSARAARQFAEAHVGALILSPTRELATQIAVEAQNLTTHHKGFQVQVLLGGESKPRQVREWARGRKDVVVATPGRLMDLLDSEPQFARALAGTKMLILDEADTLLDMGFQDAIKTISDRLPRSPERQTFLFSATVSKPIQSIASKLLHPKHLFVNCVPDTDTATHAHIPQYTTTLKSGAEAFPHLLRLIIHDQLLCKKDGRKSKVIVFFSTTKMTQLFADFLAEAASTRGGAGQPAIFPFVGRDTRTYEMHAKRDMSRRIAVSNAFRNDVSPSTASVLITSDVSARGVDYPGVTRVIQMGVPPSADMYVHRVGRTGRGGDKAGQGRGDLVVMEWEEPFVRRIAKEVGWSDWKKPTSGPQARVRTDDRGAGRARPETIRAGEPGGRRRVGRGADAQSRTAGVRRPWVVGEDASPYQASAPASEIISSTFVAQLGFYVGRAGTTGISSARVLEGLQAYFQAMCALPAR